VFIEKTCQVGFADEDLIPPVGVEWCPSLSPNGGKWFCTRHNGHDGPHLAGTGPFEYAAEWDDNRSTDPVADLFIELGLEL
jgi:hypothetical protein